MKALCVIVGAILMLLALQLYGGSEFTHNRGGTQYAIEAGHYLTLAWILGPVGLVLFLVGLASGGKGKG